VFGKGLLEQWLQGDKGAPHLYVAGGSGAGKTSFVKNLVMLLVKQQHNIYVVDFDGEYTTLPLQSIKPPFPLLLSDKSTLGWVLSQVSRPEEGGFATAILTELYKLSDELNNLEEAISRIRHDQTIPVNIRYALLWRLSIFKKNFFISNDNHSFKNSSLVFDLSSIQSIRERQAVQMILTSYLAVIDETPSFIVVEEAQTGPWLTDVAMLARRRKKRLILVSQRMPDDIMNYEIIIFTPYFPVDLRRLPLPTNPSLDRGVWWVGRLGIHRIKHLW